ncbi:MAG: carboxylating nicotinate-nucleotide diphosphorylase [Natronospirillum sp.]
MKLITVPYADRLRKHIDATVAFALQEDLEDIGDVTAALIPEEQMASAHIIIREDAIFCGRAWLDTVFKQLDERVTVQWKCADGDTLTADSVVCELTGPARSLLTGERTALNFVQTLSGTATLSRRYADAARPHHVTVLDTRKTLPGLRLAQKYAVFVGGCQNHRLGLYDTYLIKENHIAAAGGITAAIQRAQDLRSTQLIVVEVETFAEYQEAVEAGADRIMLDELSDSDLQQVLAQGGDIPLESSGNFDLEKVELAKTPYVSVGSLTKHVRAVDYSMRFIND